jgi:hypothetical protein
MSGNPLISRKTVHYVVRTWSWVLVRLIACAGLIVLRD